MNIAVIVCTFPPYKGGMGNAAFEQARQLVKLGNEVTVFTTRYKKSHKKFEEIDGVKVRRLTPVFKYGNGAFLPQVVRKLGKFDVVFLHYPFFGAAEFIWLSLRLASLAQGLRFASRRPKFVIQYHMDVVRRGWLRLFFRVYARILMPMIIKSADKVICSSFDYVRNSDARGLLDERWVEIPFGVDIREIEKQRNREIKGFDPPFDSPPYQGGDNKGEKMVLFVGALDKAHYFKGVNVLIEAFFRLTHTNVYANDMRIEWANNLKLIIVGGGDMKSEYQKLVADKDLDERVEFAGRVSDSELVEYYRQADVFVLPSVDRCEAFGMVLIEAMSFGVPVIASDLPGVRSVVDDGVNGFLVKPRDADDLAKKIKWVLEHSDEAKKMGENGRRKVEEKYDWEKIGHKLLQIFNE